MRYRPTIGLEVHAELKTRTKMFCNSKNDPDETRPNLNVCPVCLAHPGTLPVINREAVRHLLCIGSAVGGTLAEFTEFDRKSYFYPDIPKGYQISQYQHPLVTGGTLAGVALTRIHLEEDTARSIHGNGMTRIDFNRAGIPLMELVTEPVIPDAETAGRFARELQLLLRTLEVSAANLEKGEMRIEANVSIAGAGKALGTKVEIKNLNSFRSVERAITFEVARQTARLERGETVVQETRGWDEAKQETFHQRFKEGSADYRYFPEPDLPKLYLSDIQEFVRDAIQGTLPELPWERRMRYQQTYTLKESDTAYLTATVERSRFFDAVAVALQHNASHCTLAAHYIVSDLAGLFARQGSESYATLSPDHFAKLIRLVADGTLSSRGAKDTLARFIETATDPEDIARESGLIQIHDPAKLVQIVEDVCREETKALHELRAGKQAALQYLVGKAMKKSKGAGNPEQLRKLILERV